jgi:hypothetical protein
MTRTRVFCTVALCAQVLLSALPAAAQTLYSVAQGDANLRTIDPATAQTLTSTPMTLAGMTINGATGLAVQPGTGTMFVVLNVQGVSGRVLGTVNPATGVVTQIGNTGGAVAGIAFSCTGTLYGVTGENGPNPESLFTINTATAAMTFVGTFGRGDDGEAIGFNPVDNLVYHASGHFGDFDPMSNSGVIFERVDPNVMPFAPVDIPIAGTVLVNEEAQALTFEASSGMFLWKQNHGTGPLFRVNAATGAATQVGTMDMDHQAKGLAYGGVAATCGPGTATDFSIATTSPTTLVLTVKPGVPGTFMVRLTPIPAGSTFGAQVDVTCSTSPFVGTCSGGTVPAGTGQIYVPITVTPTIFGSAPPMGGSPLLWLWVAAVATALMAVGVYGRRRVARLGYAVTLGAALLVVSLGMLQSACAGSTGQKLQGPYQVTVTATSGSISHSTSATYNVSK